MSAARLPHWTGFDRAVVVILLSRGWSVVAGLATVLLIGKCLTPELQGYYFTLGSLVALQVLVELGLTQSLVHFASHEAAGLAWTADGRLQGPLPAQQRLRSLLRFGLYWFAAGGLAMVAVLLPLGLMFLNWGGDGAERAAGSLVWVLLVPLAAANLITTAALAVLEGCGKVAEVSLARLAQAVVSTLALWVGLAGGAGLLALAFQSAAMLASGVLWLACFHRAFFLQLGSRALRGQGVDWRTEIWPFQWRMAVSWASGILIAQIFNPLLFASRGPVAAGQMGLALQVLGALNLMAMAWITAQVPSYGRLIAQKRGRELDRAFRRGLLQSTVVLVSLLAALLLALWWLTARHSPIATRLPEWPLTAALCAVALANHFIFAQASLLRAHKQDPFMPVSVASGVLTAILCFAWIPAYGLAGAVAAYGVATLVIGLCGGTVVFLRKRRAWWLSGASTPLVQEGHP